MTAATFEFDASHKAEVCKAPPGKIKGVLHPDLTGGTYDISFIVGGNTCAEATGVASPDGADVDVETDHACGTGVKEITVIIVQKGDSPSENEQMPEVRCLA